MEKDPKRGMEPQLSEQDELYLLGIGKLEGHASSINLLDILSKATRKNMNLIDVQAKLQNLELRGLVLQINPEKKVTHYQITEKSVAALKSLVESRRKN